MRIKQHKRFGGICICSIIMLAHGKLKFLLASPFLSSLLPDLRILSPIKELLEQMRMVLWGRGKQRERKRRDGDEKTAQGGLFTFPSEAKGSHITRKGFFFLRFYLLIFRERGGRKRGRETSMCERYIDRLSLARPQLGTWLATQGMCPDWESNQQPFGSQAGTQSTEPHQPGQERLF